MKNYFIVILLFYFLNHSLSALADVDKAIRVMDDSGAFVSLDKPAIKVISLSPGLTELVAAAGGLDKLQAVVSYSDFPPQVKKLPQAGSYNALDIEKILLLQPDLVVAWKSGNPKHQIEKLKKLGLNVYISEPDDFMDIPDTLLRLGKLMATEKIAQKNAAQFIEQFEQLKKKYPLKKNKSVFIQIWNKPLMSVNQHHLISKVISLCGGENIFADTLSLTLSPSIESILEKNPDIMIATGMADTSVQWLNRWRQWPFLSAVKNKQLYAATPAHLVRHTPRILLGIEEVCQLIH